MAGSRLKLTTSLVAVIVGSLSQSAFAQTCIDDVWKAHGNSQNLTCTANDVKVASASNIKSIDGQPLSQCVRGQVFSFLADFTVQLNAQARYDVGLYFATDGDPNKTGALTGTCDANIITARSSVTGLGSPNFIQLDPSPDTCGDIDSAHNPQIVTVRIDNALCVDTDGDGTLNLPNCTSWRTSGNDTTCQTSTDAFPGSPSKCNCDIGFNVPILVETGSISVTKTASPLSLPEPGGQFVFTVATTNTSQFTTVTMNQICDDKYGTVASSGTSTCGAGTLGSINGTTCTLPKTLGPGASYSCTFAGNVIAGGPTTSTDTVTVSGLDQNRKPVSSTASAQVAITDVPPTAMVTKSLNGLSCADVSYHVKVQNTDSAEALTLSALSDDGFGALGSVHDSVLSTTCAVPQTIAKAGVYECDFTAHFCGTPHTDTITGTLRDNENNVLTQTSNSLTVTASATTQP
jgi:hypothetical protein